MFKKAGKRKPLIYHVEKAGLKMLRPVRNGILRVGRRIALQLLLVLVVGADYDVEMGVSSNSEVSSFFGQKLF